MSEQNNEYNMDWDYTNRLNNIWNDIQKGVTISDHDEGMLYAIETIMGAPAAAMLEEVYNLLEDIQANIKELKENPEQCGDIAEDKIVPVIECKPTPDEDDLTDEQMLELLDDRD